MSSAPSRRHTGPGGPPDSEADARWCPGLERPRPGRRDRRHANSQAITQAMSQAMSHAISHAITRAQGLMESGDSPFATVLRPRRATVRSAPGPGGGVRPALGPDTSARPTAAIDSDEAWSPLTMNRFIRRP